MLYALVVIYNKSCDESQSLVSLRSISEQISVIVFDNSTMSNANKEWCNERGYTYYSESKNIGLSKAYNIVLSKLKKSDHDYIMILDDDTYLPENYFHEVFRKIQNPQYQLLLPIVMSGELMMSPCKMVLGCKPSGLHNKNEIDISKISAINSGMVVRLDVYKRISYDENMFLDCVDHDFMNQVRQQGLKICIMESEIQQNYSLNSKGTIESAVFRFAIQKKDLKAYYKKNNHMLVCDLYILWIAMKLAIKYKSFKFFIL